jgi:CHASE3 domain sensor protein
MSRHWTFGRKLGLGFAATVALSIAIGVVSIHSLRAVIASKDHVITVDGQMLVEAARLSAAVEQRGGAVRGFLLTGEERFAEQASDARRTFSASLERARRGAPGGEAHALLDAIERSETDYHQALERLYALRRADTTMEAVSAAFEEQLVHLRDQLDDDIRAFVSYEERSLEAGRIASTETASAAIMLLVVIGCAAILCATVVAFILARTLGRQISAAVGQVQSSSAELQAAANQQATGAREQATAMSEITTTISELLATSRQIAESAQRVAQVADETAMAASSGDGTVGKAHEAIA